jgi:predicted nucleotide-binding protein
MPTSRNPTSVPPENGRFTPEQSVDAKDLLRRRISELGALTPKELDFVRAAGVALDRTNLTVRDIFGSTSDDARVFSAALIQAASEVAIRPFGDPRNRANVEHQGAVARIEEAVVRLRSLIDSVDERTVEQTVTPSPAVSATLSRRVFVVHGHDEGAKQTVARLLESLDLEPIILHEQVDKGRTVIEKFEDYADVGFAVILMTADDRGGRCSASMDDYQLRARQNVVLEMGFFLGCLGRGGVCMLYDPQIEMPSDYAGVLGKKFDDAGAWKLELAREIDAAGIEVNFNRLKK